MRKNTRIDLHIQLNNTRIMTEKTKTVKFLGVHIQNNLSWEVHSNEKAKRISQTLAALSKIRHIISKLTALKIYTLLIESHLIYGILSWGNAPARVLKHLKKVQKRAVRIVCNARCNSHTDPLFILKIGDLFKLNCCKLYYKN